MHAASITEQRYNTRVHKGSLTSGSNSSALLFACVVPFPGPLIRFAILIILIGHHIHSFAGGFRALDFMCVHTIHHSLDSKHNSKTLNTNWLSFANSNSEFISF